MLRDSLAFLAFAAVVMSVANVVCHLGAEVSLPRLNGLNEPVAVLIPLFASLALTLRRRRAALLCGAAAVTGWLSVLQIAERSHFFAIVGGLVLLALMMCASRRFRPHSLARVAILAALFAACVGLQVNPSFFRETGRDSVIVRLQQTSVADPSARARLLYWAAAFEMMRAQPLNGVGGGGYDSAFASARAAYAVREPGSPLLGVNERYLTAGAHNEYLQIASELGVVGVGLFTAFCVALVWGAWRALRAGRGPLVPGAVASLAVFAVSSGASSISFRWFGSGLAFFFAAAVVQRFMGPAREHERQAVSASDGRPARRAYALGLALSAVAALAMCVQAAGVMLLSGAQAAADPARAERLYRSALALNPLDAGAHYNYGTWLFYAKREREAVPHLRYALARGFTASVCYGYLAAAESLGGDLDASARTLEEASRVYPRSVFLRVRLASTLRRLGRGEQAELEMGRAALVDSRAARGWRELIDNDIDAAIAAARRDGQVAMPGELQPEDGVRAVIVENERRFPEAAGSVWRARLRRSLAE